MNEKNTHAVPGNQHDEAVCKLQTYTMTRVSLLVMYSSPGGQAREVQRMIVYKMTHPRLTCDPVRLAARLVATSRREQWKLRPNAWKIPDCLRRAGAASWTGPSAMCFSTFSCC